MYYPLSNGFYLCFLQIEIKMKKPEAVRWEKLEGHGDEPTTKQFTAGLCFPVAEA